MRHTISTDHFAASLQKHSEEGRCGFCYPREQGTHGEIKREWSPTWNMFINFCPKHSPQRKEEKMITYAYGSLVDFTDGAGTTHTGRIYATWQSRDTALGYLIMPCGASLDC